MKNLKSKKYLILSIMIFSILFLWDILRTEIPFNKIINLLLTYIFSSLIFYISISTASRINIFFKKTKSLKNIVFYSSKNRLLLLISYFLTIGIPLILIFKNRAIDEKLIIIPLIIIAIILGIHSFLGITAEIYTRNNINNYQVENGPYGSELLGTNIGKYDKGFIIDTYIFKYSNIDYYEDKNNTL